MVEVCIPNFVDFSNFKNHPPHKYFNTFFSIIIEQKPSLWDNFTKISKLLYFYLTIANRQNFGNEKGHFVMLLEGKMYSSCLLKSLDLIVTESVSLYILKKRRINKRSEVEFEDKCSSTARSVIELCLVKAGYEPCLRTGFFRDIFLFQIHSVSIRAQSVIYLISIKTRYTCLYSVTTLFENMYFCVNCWNKFVCWMQMQEKVLFDCSYHYLQTIWLWK